MSDAVIFFCHGSRDARWREPFDAIARAFADRYPRTPVRLAFLELMSPDLGAAIDELAGAGVRAIRVLPLFLAPGTHTRRDLPALIDAARARWPGLRIDDGPTLTEVAAIREAIVSWAAPGDAG
ncbi:MAG: CbiX/SirB N-terminal domain-containing protein [Burkholderiaceae bacterium]